MKAIHPHGYASRSSSLDIRISERYLKLTKNVLCEQRRNLVTLPIRDRQTGCQCATRGSGPVVVGGVTTTQGVQESWTQGKGVYTPTVPRTNATDSNMLYHGVHRDQRRRGNGTLEQAGSEKPGNTIPTTLGETGYPLSPGQPAFSMTCHEGLTTLPGHGQLVDL
jgi:hypothetical protein